MSNTSAPNSLSNQNRDFFDAHADFLFGQDWVKKTSEQETRFLREHANTLGLKPAEEGTQVKLLDYACGNGVASWALAPYVTTIRGIDVSSEMVTRFNAAASAFGLSWVKAHATVGDLSSPREAASATPGDPALSSPDYSDFDVAIISLALHHVSNPAVVLSAIASRLKSGGVLIVVEGTNHEEFVEAAGRKGHNHERDASKTISKEPLSEENLRKWFSAAGCDDAKFVRIVNEENSPVPESVCGIPGGFDRSLFFAASVKS